MVPVLGRSGKSEISLRLALHHRGHSLDMLSCPHLMEFGNVRDRRQDEPPGSVLCSSLILLRQVSTKSIQVIGTQAWCIEGPFLATGLCCAAYAMVILLLTVSESGFVCFSAWTLHLLFCWPKPLLSRSVLGNRGAGPRTVGHPRKAAKEGMCDLKCQQFLSRHIIKQLSLFLLWTCLFCFSSRHPSFLVGC